jgi:hypothetical protein
MTEDLLTRIQCETHERLSELRGAVDEHDRLAAELRTLDTVPEPSADLEPVAALEVVPEIPVATESSVASASPANVVRLPARPRVSSAGMVSPKVARLMRAPRRPALERAGVVRVGSGRVGSSAAADDLWPEEMREEVDAEAALFEHSL